MEIDGGELINLNFQFVGRISNGNCDVYDRASMCFIDLASDRQRKGILSTKICFGGICKSRSVQYNLARLRRRHKL